MLVFLCVTEERTPQLNYLMGQSTEKFNSENVFFSKAV